MSAHIICEVGCEHVGSIYQAIDLIDTAKIVGADTIKFQAYTKEEVGEAWDKYNLGKYILGETELNMLKSYAEDTNIGFLCSAFGLSSLRVISSIGCETVKVPSGKNEDTEYLQLADELFDIIIMSNGMTDHMTDFMSNKKVVLLECTSAYPCEIRDVNLQHMIRKCDGISDHTLDWTVPVAAAALGAKVIEKHMTLNKMGDTPDARTSLDPKEFMDMVNRVRDIEAAMVNKEKQIHECERGLLWRKL
jgi:N,N'-diacetyllegionaminate synthase